MPGTWKRWSRNHDWVARAQAYDEHLDGVVREAREAHASETGSDWAALRDRLRKDECELGDKLLAIARKAIEAFEERETFTDLTTKDLERLVLTGSKLQRLSIGLATERTEDMPDLGSLSEEELADLAASSAKPPDTGIVH